MNSKNQVQIAKRKGKKQNNDQGSLLVLLLLLLFIILLIKIKLMLGKKFKRIVSRGLLPLLVLLRSLGSTPHSRTTDSWERFRAFILVERNPHVFVKGAGLHASASVQRTTRRACRDVCIAILETNRDNGQIVDMRQIPSDNGLGDLGIDFLNDQVAAYASVLDLLVDVCRGDVAAWSPFDGSLHTERNVSIKIDISKVQKTKSVS